MVHTLHSNEMFGSIFSARLSLSEEITLASECGQQIPKTFLLS